MALDTNAFITAVEYAQSVAVLGGRIPIVSVTAGGFLMGAFNLVKTQATCPACDQTIEIAVQFKYGDTWQHTYKISQPLRWGGNDVGKPGKAWVVVDGVAETPCPLCGFDDEWNFYVFLIEDRIVRVEPATGAYDFARVQSTYIVLQE